LPTPAFDAIAKHVSRNRNYFAGVFYLRTRGNQRFFRDIDYGVVVYIIPTMIPQTPPDARTTKAVFGKREKRTACARIADEFGRKLLSRARVNDAARHYRAHDVLRPATSCSAFNRQSRRHSASAS